MLNYLEIIAGFVKKGRSKFDASKYRFFEFYTRELRYYGKEEDGRGAYRCDSHDHVFFLVDSIRLLVEINATVLQQAPFVKWSLQMPISCVVMRHHTVLP